MNTVSPGSEFAAHLAERKQCTSPSVARHLEEVPGEQRKASSPGRPGERPQEGRPVDGCLSVPGMAIDPVHRRGKIRNKRPETPSASCACRRGCHSSRWSPRLRPRDLFRWEQTLLRARPGMLEVIRKDLRFVKKQIPYGVPCGPSRDTAEKYFFHGNSFWEMLMNFSSIFGMPTGDKEGLFPPKATADGDKLGHGPEERRKAHGRFKGVATPLRGRTGVPATFAHRTRFRGGLLSGRSGGAVRSHGHLLSSLAVVGVMVDALLSGLRRQDR